MASSVSAPMAVPQATKRTHPETSSSNLSSQENQGTHCPSQSDILQNTTPVLATKISDVKCTQETAVGNTVSKLPVSESTPESKLPVSGSTPVSSNNSHIKESVSALTSMTTDSKNMDKKQSAEPVTDSLRTIKNTPNVTGAVNHPIECTFPINGSSANNSSPNISSLCSAKKDKTFENPSTTDSSPSCLKISGSDITGNSTQEPLQTSLPKQEQNMEAATSQSMQTATKNSTSVGNKPPLEDGEEPEKKAKIVASNSQSGGKTPEQILEYMDKTFDQRRKIITKQMPSIPELKELYPELLTGKQLLIEFQRITKIDIDQKIQEFCVRYATAVIEMASNNKEAAPVLARWEQAKQENDTLRQYWDMVTALCLLPLHFGENFVEMVLEIGEDEEVVPQGKIVPTLVARGNIFRTDEFFLIAENTIVQEFEEFTIAFASLYSSYWVFNMEYPETIANTYNYIQRCIVRQREPGSIPIACKNFTKALLKWNKGKEAK